jgi:hypothetical protein
MKSFIKITLLLFLPVLSIAQEKNIDSLKAVYRDASTDSARYATGRALYYYYEELNRDSALYYADENLKLAQKNSKKLAEAASLVIKGYQLLHEGKVSCFIKMFVGGIKNYRGQE